MSQPVRAQFLAGRVAIVTGGGRGIGRAAAEELARYGASVALAARGAREIEDVAHAIAAGGGRAVAVATDVGDEGAVARLVARTEESFGGCDILVNAAAINGPVCEMEDMTLAAWEEIIRINLTGTFLACRAVVPRMKRNRWGRIINFGSGIAIRAQPSLSAYGATKAAVVHFSRIIAEELRPFGINVFALHPGLVRTALVEEQLAMSETGVRGQLIRRLKSVTMVEPSYCAPFFPYLASDAAADLSGQFVIHDDPAFQARVKAFIAG